MSVRQGINVFLKGEIPSENLRFRDEELTFQVSETVTELTNDSKEHIKSEIESKRVHVYPNMTKTLGAFKLTVQSGCFQPSEVVMMLGQNGTGKTTLIKLLAGIIKPDDEDALMP